MAEAEGRVNIIIKATNKADKGISGAVSSFDKLGKAAGAAVLGGAVVAGAAVAGVAAKGIMEFTKFEDSMNEVFTLLPNITEEAMGKMNDQVLAASENMGRLPNEVIPALYQSLSAGVPQENVFEFLDTAHAAALGGVTELETAVDGISSVVNAYGSDVMGATEASDLMFTAVRLGKTTFGELSSSLSNVTPLASGMGVSFGDVTAALAAMTSQGTPTAQATTQMRSLLQELGTAGTEVADTFTELAGETFLEFVQNGGNTAEALQLLEKHAADTGVPLQDMFGNVRAGLGALQLTGKGMDTFMANLEEMEGSAGATDAAYQRMNQGFARTIEVLKAKATTTFIKIGDALSPLIKMIGEKFLTALDDLSPVLDKVTGFISGFFEVLFGKEQQFGDTSFHVAGIVEKIQALVDTGGSIRDFFTVFEDGSTNLDALFQLFGMGEEEAQALGAQVSNLAAKFFEIYDAVVEFITPIWEAIQNFVSWKDILIVVAGIIGGVVLSAIVSIVTAIGPLLLAIGAAIAVVAILRNAWENNWGGIQEKVTAVIGFLQGLIGTVVAWITAFWKENGDEILASAKQVWETIKQVISTIINIISTVIKAVVSGIQAFWKAHGDQIMAIANQVWNWIKETITTLINTIRDIITTVTTAIQEFWAEHGETIKAKAEEIWEAIKSFIDSIFAIITDIFHAFQSAFEGDWQGFGENLREAWDKVWEGIKTALTEVIPKLLTAIGDFILDVIAKFQEVDWGEVGRDLIQGIADGVGNAAGILINAAKAAAKAAWDAIVGFFDMGSPSRLMMEVGVNVIKGLGLGILNEQKNLLSTIGEAIGPTVNFAATGRQNPQLVGQPFGPSSTANYNLTVVTQETSADIISNFRILEAWSTEV